MALAIASIQVTFFSTLLEAEEGGGAPEAE